MKPESGKHTTYTVLETRTVKSPSIKFSKKAVKWISAMADLHETEVGLFGLVEETGENSYLVYDIFYPKHCLVSGATCEISPEGETLMGEWMVNNGRENEVGRLRFWGHSHVNMGVSPSGQDEIQSVTRMNQKETYIIRGIFNKKGEMSVSFYDYLSKRRFDNIEWTVDGDAEEAAIRAKIVELKATHIPTTAPHVNSYAPIDNQFSEEYYQNYGNGYNQFRYQQPPLTPAAGKFNPVNLYKGRNRKHSYANEFQK